MNTTQAQLGAVLAAGGPQLTRLLESTESHLAEIAQGHGVELARHASGTLFAGGKRLRPMLEAVVQAGRARRPRRSSPRRPRRQRPPG